MSSTKHSRGKQDLPPKFVSWLKVLFDILDEPSSGFVHLSDIETRWKGADVEGLPKGVIEAWRNVAFPDRKLNFDRFISGIRVALMQQTHALSNSKPIINNFNKQSNNYDRNIYESNRNQPPKTHPDIIAHHHPNEQRSLSPSRQYSRESSVYGRQSSNEDGPYSQSIPSGPQAVPSMAKLRTFSMPQLTNVATTNNVPISQNRSFSPTNHVARSNSQDNIADVLKKWQHDRMDNNPPASEEKIWRNDPRSSVASMSALDRYGGATSKPQSTGGDSDSAVDDVATRAAKRRISRRSDGRRHTVTNGVDFQMLKRMKQLELEKDVLLHGLEALEHARDWYHSQIRTVQDKQKYLGTTVQQDHGLDSNQERANLQAVRISEVNQQLNSLVDSSKKGFSLHMNLALHPMSLPQKAAPSGDDMSKQLQEHNNLVTRLKQQNKQLTQEVGQKSERISKLEQEKSQLVREMFQLQAAAKNRRMHYEESSYI